MPVNLKDYKEPANMEEALRRKLSINEDIILLQSQLGNKNHTDEYGNRLSEHEYQDWRSRANYKLVCLKAEQLRINLWIKERSPRGVNKSKIIENGLNPNDPNSLLIFINKVIHTICSDGVKLQEDEQAIVDCVADYVDLYCDKHFRNK